MDLISKNAMIKKWNEINETKLSEVKGEENNVIKFEN